MSLPEWVREAEGSVTDGGIIAGPQARRLLALVRQMGEALEAGYDFTSHVVICSACKDDLECADADALSKRWQRMQYDAIGRYRHGPKWTSHEHA